MSKIREEAKVVIQHHYGVLDTKQAKRVILLERAYRYQRAAYHLMHEVIQNEFDTSLKCFDMAVKKMREAADLYRQAEEL